MLLQSQVHGRVPQKRIDWRVTVKPAGKNATGKNGTGLGLYIVKYMIEKMGGKVDLISNDGLCVKLFFKKIVS